jgi:hypothetical protein
MELSTFELALDLAAPSRQRDQTSRIKFKAKAKRVSDRTLSYTERHKGQWFRPEYNLADIQIAQTTSSYFAKAVQKKTDRLLIAGWEFVGHNPDTVAYVRDRVKEIELASNRPFVLQMVQTAADLLRFSNCMWAKARNDKASSGARRPLPGGKVIDPVAGYFILPFETLEFKTKANGEIKRVRQVNPTGRTKEFAPEDVVHLFRNKIPGFAIGTPEVSAVLDDISLLRRIEENVEELIESNLYPLFHYQVGSDAMPERYSPEGIKETDIIKQTIEYMPAGGIYVSDHRHEITAIGSEGRALRVDSYLEYFKKRVFAGLGMSGVDFGEGDSANKATADVLSKGAMQDIEALQKTLKYFIEFFVIREILLEGPFGFKTVPDMDMVEIKFGIVDKEVQSKLENQTIQLWQNNLINEGEARKELGRMPVEDDFLDTTFFKKYEEPLALLKSMIAPDSAAGNALAVSPQSSITPEGVKKEAAAAKTSTATATGPRGRPATKSAKKNTSLNISRPTNQQGTRSGPKLSGDSLTEWFDWADNLLDESDLMISKRTQFRIEFDKLVSNYVQLVDFIEDADVDIPEWRFYALLRKYLGPYA